MPIVKASFFTHLMATVPEPWEGPWPDFVNKIGPHALVQNKDSVHLYSPIDYSIPYRKKANVNQIYCAVLDFDESNEGEMNTILDKFLGLEVSFLFHTTHRHWKYVCESGVWRARIIAPLAEPVSAKKWPDQWLQLNAFVDYKGDMKCKDAGRMYYVASCPPDELQHAHWELVDGEPLDISKLGSSSVSVPVSIEKASEPVTKEDVKTHATALVRRGGKIAQWGRALKKIVEGEPFAEPGNRDNTINILCRFYLIPYFPNAIIEQLAEVFKESIEKMMAIDSDCPSLDVVKEKLERARTEYLTEKHQQEEAAREEKKDEVLRAFRRAGKTRDEPYKKAELDEYAREAGLDGWSALKHQLIVQRGGSYFVWICGTYEGPVKPEDAAVLIPQVLAPITVNEELAVDLNNYTLQGVKPMTLPQMVQRYGVIAKEIVVDMRQQKTIYDAAAHQLIEAPCPLRDLKSEYSKDVDTWLRLMTGDKYETVVNWVTFVFDLDKSCTALYLQGPPGVGKSLFAVGLSRLWSEKGPTALEAAMGNFNEILSKCPLVFADEVLPKTFQGEARTGEIRRFIQDRSRKFSRKFVPDAELVGCVRLIMAANNTDMLNTAEELSENDIAAIVERVIYVQVQEEVKEFLDQLGPEGISKFVEEDAIAKHALWLRDNHKVEAQGRFLVKSEVSDLHRKMQTGVGLRAAVCDWLVKYLLKPARFDALGSGLVRRINGELLVSARALSEHWDMYKTNVKPPQQAKISKALAGLSKGRRKVRNPSAHLRVVDVDLLMYYANEAEHVDEEEFAEALKRPQLIPVVDVEKTSNVSILGRKTSSDDEAGK